MMLSDRWQLVLPTYNPQSHDVVGCVLAGGQPMRRRDLITLLGGAAAVWPLVAWAQTERMRRIGVLMGSADNAPGQARVRAFQQTLAKLGWSQGRNLAIEYRWAEGRIEPLAPSAAELVRLKVEVIVGQGTPPTV